MESAAARRKRTIKIIRSTILISGGLIGATLVDLLGLVITLLGFWDCVEAIRDDAAAMNRQNELRRIVQVWRASWMRSRLNSTDAGLIFRMEMNLKARLVGPFKDEASALAFLRDRLVVALRPRAIWQFGSRARGDHREHSDFDLLVVLPDGLPREAYAPHRVAGPVLACGLGYDIVPCAWSEFLKDGDVPGTLVRRVVTEGKPIYRDPLLRKAERAA